MPRVSLIPARMGLAKQLGLLLVIPIALALGVYGYFTHESRQQVLMAEASAELRNHASLVEAAVDGAVERGEVHVLKERLERLARADRILGIAAFTANGDPLLVTDHLEQASAELSELARVAFRAGLESEEARDLAGIPTLVRTVIFSPKARAPVVAVLARDLRYVAALGSQHDRGLALTGAVLLGAAALLVMLLTRATVARPANAIAAGAERITSGELGTTVPEKGAEELVRLARAFNAMTLSLREARAQADREAARRVEEEAGRVSAERKLQHARALAAVGQVAASIGHEIGSPLGVILGRARLMAEHSECPDAMKRDLMTIAEQSDRISRVVARLLAVARAPRIAARASNIMRVGADVLQFLGPECRQRRIRSRIEGDETTVMVALDPDQLFQVLFNLCWNAIEAQPEGGDLLIRVRSGPRVAGTTSRVTIEIVDRGPGVPPDLASRIFDPFFTTKSDRAGTGLGLDIVSGIAREAGGSVELIQAEPPGACFRVTLPAARVATAPVDIRELGS